MSSSSNSLSALGTEVTSSNSAVARSTSRSTSSAVARSASRSTSSAAANSSRRSTSGNSSTLAGNSSVASWGSVSDEKSKKNVLCWYWENEGWCPYKNKNGWCKYAHGDAELEIVDFPTVLGNYKTEICDDYFKYGYCNFGAGCYYYHEEFEKRGKEEMKKEVPCPFYSRSGLCYFNAENVQECSFYHH